MSVGALQTAVDSLRVSPLNVQRSTHSSQKAASYGQRLLPFRKELLPTSDSVSVSRSDERLLNNNRLFQFATSSNNLQIQQINRSLQLSADTSVGSTMTSARFTSRKPFLDDDQILELIENKLKKFRTQMAKQRGPSASSLNVQASSSPQGSSPVTSSASGAVVKAAENMAARAGDGENPNGSGKKPEGTPMESAPEGTTMESAPNDKHFTECDQSAIIITAVHSNMVDENHDSMVLRATFGSPLGELVTKNPGFTVQHKPSNHEHNAAVTADSTLSWLPPKSLACTVYNQQPFGTDSDNETSHTVETSNLIKSNSSAGLGNLTLKSSQIFNVNKVPDVTSSVANYRKVTEPEPQLTEPTEQRVDIGVQVGQDRIEMDKREWSSIQGYPEFEDITDDESDITQQVSIQESTHHITPIREFMQSPKPITNVESSTNVTSEPAERPTPKQQEPKVPLTCSCPYFVETDDGFEKVPCPKCAQATPFTKEEEESEEESDSEEVILFVSDLVLEDEIIDLVSSDDEEEENVSSAEQQNQNAIFQPVEEFETFASFYESKVKRLRKDLPNPLVATGAKPVAPAESEPPLCTLSKNEPVEKVDSEQVLPHCSSQKWNFVEKASEIAPAPKLLGISEKFSPDKDNSSDTDNSSDYPSHTQSNYLTASLRALSPQSSDSSIEELGESLQSPPETLDTSGWFPVLTPDIQSEVEAANQPTVASKTTTGPVESTEGSKTPFRKAKYKSRRVIESDSESEDDQDGHETGSSAKNRVDWDQRDVGPVKSVQNSSGLQRFEKSSSKLPAMSVSSTQPLKSSLKPQSSSLSTHLPEPRPEAHTQNVSSVSRKVLDNVDQSKAFKQKKTKTDPKSNRQVKRKRPSPDTGKQCSQIMAEQASGSRTHAPPGANAQNATPDLSKELNGKLVLYSEGKPYRASSLPPQNHSQLTSNLIRKTQPNPQTPPKSHDSPLSTNVNSYSTAKSAPAKQGVVKDWSNYYISIRKERRRSHEAEQPIKAQNVKTVSTQATCPPKRRRRRNSQNLHGPLMKKSKRQAQTWTKAVHYKESSIPSEANISDRYKWKEKKPVEDHVDDEWLDRMHGEPFKRPHY